jgi:acyl-[acyl carrier protein]--UDP-N-acetylglucosamine O-acyltransferase
LGALDCVTSSLHSLVSPQILLSHRGEKARLELQFGVDIWLVVGGIVVVADRVRLEAGAIVEEIDTGNEGSRVYGSAPVGRRAETKRVSEYFP